MNQKINFHLCDPNRSIFDDPYSDINTGNVNQKRAIFANVVQISFGVYPGRTQDNSKGATLYYSPRSMKPSGAVPDWNFKLLNEVKIPGIRSNYLKVYKNK